MPDFGAERSAEQHVQFLQAPADTEDGFSRLDHAAG
jgi:hypothetical protein